MDSVPPNAQDDVPSSITCFKCGKETERTVYWLQLVATHGQLDARVVNTPGGPLDIPATMTVSETLSRHAVCLGCYSDLRLLHPDHRDINPSRPISNEQLYRVICQTFNSTPAYCAGDFLIESQVPDLRWAIESGSIVKEPCAPHTPDNEWRPGRPGRPPNLTHDGIKDKLKEYINTCVTAGRPPGVSGFGRFCGVERETARTYLKRVGRSLPN